MTIRKVSDNQNPRPGGSQQNIPSENRDRTINRGTEDFDEGNPKTNYGPGRQNLSNQTRPASKGRMEEGDEDYDDEDRGKDFDDYNSEYQSDNSE